MGLEKVHFIGCHNNPERSFFWRGKQFPLCARCTGIHLGYLLMPLFLFDWWHIPLLYSILMILPTYIDGWSQLILKRESTNWLRFSTGLLAGVGLMSLAAIIGDYIATYLKTLI